MADAAQLMERLNAGLPELRSSVLVPNLKGLERAVGADAKEIAVVLSATETMNRKNINMGLDARSEEHTSELQSLMRNSYAVFCLKKKNNTQETCTIHMC